MFQKVSRKLLFNRFTRRALDFLLSPLTLLSCLLLKYLRTYWTYLPVSERIYKLTGVFPVLDHYYEPLFNPSKYLKKPLNSKRNLPRINLNVEKQIELLNKFTYTNELSALPNEKPQDFSYYFNNGFFSHGDAECYYNIMRLFKPSRVYEIGSGNSTLIALMAAQKNLIETNKETRITCVEPYEAKWLEQYDLQVKREKIEEIDLSFFRTLEKDDILFIDSSHMVRPQGDVLYEFLEILPSLNSGVIVHIHDIFTPRDYPYQWIFKDHRFWNEQYFLEALLTSNEDFEILCSLNYLRHDYQSLFVNKLLVNCSDVSTVDPASFWIVKK